MSLPKVYVFSQECCSSPSTERLGIALAEDGTPLAYHVSSSEYWARRDLGVAPDVGHHADYRRKYPDGFEVVWVPCLHLHPVLSKFFFEAATTAIAAEAEG